MHGAGRVKIAPPDEPFVLGFQLITECPFLNVIVNLKRNKPQPAFTCSKLTIEALEQGVKYVQS